MTFFKNILALIRDDDNPRLHRVPFALMWIASYGLAWFTTFYIVGIAKDILYNMRAFYENKDTILWISGVVLAISFSLVLVSVQTWLIRKRYGFIPLLWRQVTFFGALLAGLSFYCRPYLLDYGQQWIAFFAGFSVLNMLQAVVMSRVNRQAWLLGLVGIIAGCASAFVSSSAPLDSINVWSHYENLGIFWGGLIQAVGTSIIMLHLMANPREGIVPKREPNELFKKLSQMPLTPLRFVALWTSPYFIAWALFSTTWTQIALFRQTGFGLPLFIHYGWLYYHSPWQVGLMIGLTIGITSAIIQTRLLKRYSKFKIYQWALVTIVGWVFAGIAFGYYGQSYGDSANIISLRNILLLTIWFTAPAFFQSLPIWLVIRHGWLWILTGIGSTIIGIFIDSQISLTPQRMNGFALAVMGDHSYFYVVVLGGLAYGIITGSTFILLQSQQRYTEIDTVQEK